MYFAISSNVEFDDDGKIVKKEKIDPISLNIKPPSNKR